MRRAAADVPAPALALALTLTMACVLLTPLSGQAEAPPLPADLAQRQLAAGGEGDSGRDWLLHSRNHGAWRYSPLTQINKGNLDRLGPAWTFPTGLSGPFEATPVVADGAIYFTTPWDHVYALDAATGRQLWHYAYVNQPNAPTCCGPVNRGAAIAGGKVIFESLDAHVVALDARTGELAWKAQMADIKDGYSATAAPQVVGDKVFVGVSGGELGIRGFLDAYDVATGKRLWRFWTIPGPGEPGHETWQGEAWKRGGGPVWVTPSYDRETNSVLAGVGNPGPNFASSYRPGDNLYTDCLVALDADTGKLKWHYQTVPHCVWDLDAACQAVLDDITLDGKRHKVAMFATKNGYFYVLDRTNGRFLYALPVAHKITWGKVAADGTPQVDKSKYPVEGKWTPVWPGAAGGKHWGAVAYDPKRKRLFIPCVENGHKYRMVKQRYHEGVFYYAGEAGSLEESYGHVAAIDVEKKRVAWDTQTSFPIDCGLACTASGLVIAGTPDQEMLILDSDDGQTLWRFKAHSGWHSGPIVYEAAGREFIAFANGWGGRIFQVDGTSQLQGMPAENALYVFSLPEPGPQPEE